MGYVVVVPTSPPTVRPRSQADFPASACEALLAAIATHDTVDLAAILPDDVALACDTALLKRSYRISLQLWREIDPASLPRLALRFATGRTTGQPEARAFKDIRARAKQLRFAYAMLGESHGYPPRLDRITRLMGKIQDAMRTGHRLGAAVRAAWLWAMVAGPGAGAAARELDCFAVTTPDRLRTHIRAEIARIAAILDAPAITNKAFHETRKIVSRLVAFYDTLTVLAPSEQHRAIDRYLSTINGLMGAMHDDMVERKADSRQDYLNKSEPLAPEIAVRLRRLVEVFGRG